MQIKQILIWGTDQLKKTKSANLDAEILLCHLLKKDKPWLYSHQDDILTSDRTRRYQELIFRRKTGEPVAYLTHHQEFFGFDFYVNKSVLIPRPETELLVEEALKSRKKKMKIIDIGTGSGCIIVSIAKSSPDCHSAFNAESMDSCFRRNDMRSGDDKAVKFYATDISTRALKIARKNAKKHKVKINFIKSDLFKNIPADLKFDLIIANLPYLWHNYPSFEPKLALDGGRNGLEIIKKFLKQTKGYLNKKSTILFEIDPRQANKIKELVKKYLPRKKLSIIKDLSQLDRIVKIN